MKNEEEKTQAKEIGTSEVIEVGSKENDHVSDKYYACYILIYATACILWLPATFITTASDYWMHKFQNASSIYDVKAKNYYQNYFFATCMSISEAAGVFIPVIIYVSKFISINVRMILIYFVTGGITIFTLAMVNVDTHPWQDIFYGISLSSLGFLTIICFLLYISLLELTAKFPPKYLAFVEAGNATSSILAAVIQILSIEIGTTPEKSAMIYFGFAATYIILSYTVYLIVSNTSLFYKQRISIVIEAKQTSDISFSKIKTIFWKVKIPIISITINECVHMITQPGLTSLVVSEDAGNGLHWNDVLFTPVVVYLLTSVVSVITRFVTLSFKQVENQYVLFLLCIVKVCIIPLLMFCNAQPRHYLPVIFNKDYYFIIFMLLFSILESFLNTSITLLIPRMCEPDEKYLGNVINFFVMNVSMIALAYVNVLIVKSL